MEKEDKIIGMLENIMGKLDEHSSTLSEDSSMLNEQSSTLNEHSSMLKKHGAILQDHSSKFEDHNQMLKALLSGQEHLKAELDGMKISNAKEFAAIKEEQVSISTNFELLRDDTWANKVDIHRIQKTMGMK